MSSFSSNVVGTASEDSSPTSSVFAPPTGPKVWRELQARSHSQNSQGRSSPSFPHRPRHGPPNSRGLQGPVHQARTFVTNVARPIPGRKGDFIGFGNGVRPSARRNFSESDVRPQLGRKASVPPVEELAPSVAPGRRKKKKPKAGEIGELSSTDTKADNEGFLRIQQIGSVVNVNLALLEAEMKKLVLQPESWKEAHAMATEISNRTSVILAAAKNGVEMSQFNYETATNGMDMSQFNHEAATTNGFVSNPALAQDEEPPYIPMSYQIPVDVLENKKILENGDESKNWSHTYYLSKTGEPVKVDYCQTISDCEKILPKYLDEKIVGFDMEWCFPDAGTSIRKNISLIQVANESSITLIHIGQMEKDNGDPETDENLMSPTLRAIIESDKVLKVGVNIAMDAKRLVSFFELKPKGILELSDLHHVVYCAQTNQEIIPKRLIALHRLTDFHLSLPLNKGPVRVSDWCTPITAEQMEYAAADAYAGLRIYDSLQMQRAALNPKPKFPVCRVIAEAGAEAEQAEYSGSDAQFDRTPARPRSSLASPAVKRPIAPEVEVANVWLEGFLSEHPTATGGKARLRAYGMWHNYNHEVDEICRLCRDPPLKTATVAGYILDAIYLDKLPYDLMRLQKVIGLIQYEKARLGYEAKFLQLP